MKSQVIFKIETKLKTRAMRKAKNEGVPFASVLKLATQAYVDGSLDIELSPQPKLNKKTRTLLKGALSNIKNGRDTSSSFSDTQSAIRYLKQL